MKEIYETKAEIAPSVSDATGKLGYPDTFGIFMDLASAHADRLGVGFHAMARRDLFWLTVKTQIVFKKRPDLSQSIIARTWPEIPDKIRCNRSYELEQNGEVIICGKTEWAVINTKTNSFLPAKDIYPEDVNFPQVSACALPFARISDNFGDTEPYAEYTVRSTDIDVGRHMNNTAYVRALIGSLSNAELAALNISRIDVIFRTPCYEGQKLILQKRAAEKGLDIRMSRSGETVLLASIETAR